MRATNSRMFATTILSSLEESSVGDCKLSRTTCQNAFFTDDADSVRAQQLIGLCSVVVVLSFSCVSDTVSSNETVAT